MTMIALDPSIEPSLASGSKSAGVSRCSAVRIADDDPPGKRAFKVRPGRSPPACSKMISRRGVPIGSSLTPGSSTCPETE